MGYGKYSGTTSSVLLATLKVVIDITIFKRKCFTQITNVCTWRF